MMLIRTFQPKYVPQVTALVAETFNRHYKPEFYLSLLEGWKEGFLIVEDEKGIIGVLAAMISAPKEARILLMAIRQELRGRGIGGQLLHEFLLRCVRADLKAVRLEVRITNKSAIRFYDKHGFTFISVLPSFYEDGEPGYLMRKIL